MSKAMAEALRSISQKILKKCTYISMKAAMSSRFLTGFQTETQDARAEQIDREWE